MKLTEAYGHHGAIQFRAEKLVRQILKTWNPPATGMGVPADVAQAAAMQTVAFIMGRDFLKELTPNQASAVDDGLKLITETLGGSP